MIMFYFAHTSLGHPTPYLIQVGQSVRAARSYKLQLSLKVWHASSAACRLSDPAILDSSGYEREAQTEPVSDPRDTRFRRL